MPANHGANPLKLLAKLNLYSFTYVSVECYTPLTGNLAYVFANFFFQIIQKNNIVYGTQFLVCFPPSLPLKKTCQRLWSDINAEKVIYLTYY